MNTRIAVVSLGASLFFSFAAVGCVTEVDDGEAVDRFVDPLGETNIDMADYIIPSCDKASDAWQIGSEQFRVVPMGQAQGGLGRFVIVKSSNGDGYEEWTIESEWLRIRTDTTWAYEESPGGAWCDVKCGDNAPGSCQQRWNTNPGDPRNGLNPTSPWAYTIYQEAGNPSLGAKWIQRKLSLAVGGTTEFTTQMEIKGAARNSCNACSVNFGTKPGQIVSRTVRARRYSTWNQFTDVVHLTVLAGPGQGEQYYYARGKGWIGFNNRVASGRVSSNVTPSSSCAGFNQGSICFATGGAGSSPPPPPPPPPPPRETCEESKHNDIIRCDDPKISHYDPWGEDAAFKNVVKDQGQGLKKSNRDDANKGPCKDRGGFHINVLRRGDSVASIYGCNCCDDSNGKVIRKQRTETRKKY